LSHFLFHYGKVLQLFPITSRLLIISFELLLENDAPQHHHQSPHAFEAEINRKRNPFPHPKMKEQLATDFLYANEYHFLGREAGEGGGTFWFLESMETGRSYHPPTPTEGMQYHVGTVLVAEVSFITRLREMESKNFLSSNRFFRPSELARQ
jgi:hypothetical protein